MPMRLPTQAEIDKYEGRVSSYVPPVKADEGSSQSGPITESVDENPPVVEEGDPPQQ